jgi:hypothetical protein
VKHCQSFQHSQAFGFVEKKKKIDDQGLKRLSQVLAANSSLTSVDLDLNQINDVGIAQIQRLSIFFGFMHKDAVAPRLSAVLMVKSTLTVLALAGDKNG